MPGSRRSVIRMSKAKSASRCERFLAAAGLLDDEPVVRQPLGDRLAERRLVVDDQQMFLIFRHLERADGILTPCGGRRVNRGSTSFASLAARSTASSVHDPDNLTEPEKVAHR